MRSRPKYFLIASAPACGASMRSPERPREWASLLAVTSIPTRTARLRYFDISVAKPGEQTTPQTEGQTSDGLLRRARGCPYRALTRAIANDIRPGGAKSR